MPVSIIAVPSSSVLLVCLAGIPETSSHRVTLPAQGGQSLAPSLEGSLNNLMVEEHLNVDVQRELEARRFVRVRMCRIVLLSQAR